MCHIWSILICRIILFCGALWLFSQPAHAWDATGHQVVNQIALTQLTPRAKQRVLALMEQLTPEYHDDAISAGAWPDRLKGHDIAIFNHWHYIDHTFTTGHLPLPATPRDNIVYALNQIRQILQSPRASTLEKAIFLRFYMHLVADIHQPLHCASRVTSEHLQGDHGGNLFPIRYREMTNLHELWDHGVGYFDSELHHAKGRELVIAVANEVMAEFPINEQQAALTDSPRAWSRESFDMARNYVYRLSPGGSVSKRYLWFNQQLVKRQLALAGYRLAYMLNRMFAE